VNNHIPGPKSRQPDKPGANSAANVAPVAARNSRSPKPGQLFGNVENSRCSTVSPLHGSTKSTA
jgi:hypothetical protein